MNHIPHPLPEPTYEGTEFEHYQAQSLLDKLADGDLNDSLRASYTLEMVEQLQITGSLIL